MNLFHLSIEGFMQENQYVMEAAKSAGEIKEEQKEVRLVF